MEDNTSGFYKKQIDGWLFAKDQVVSNEYELRRSEYEGLVIQDTGIDSWTWHKEAPQEYVLWLESSRSIELP